MTRIGGIDLHTLSMPSILACLAHKLTRRHRPVTRALRTAAVIIVITHTRTLGIEPRLTVLETVVLPLHHIHSTEEVGVEPTAHNAGPD